MNKDFPRIITFLRKERGLSQKQVSSDMGISQALLSHYEKGIRECGLDFLVKTADYYEVSTDFLLGRTVERNPNLQNIQFDETESEKSINSSGNMLNLINKKLLNNTTSIIYDLLMQIDNKKLTNNISNYLMSAEYMVFRILYSSSEDNSQTMFSIDNHNYRGTCLASMILDIENSCKIMNSQQIQLALSPDMISKHFEKGAASLFSLIQYSERNIKKRDI